MNLDLNFIPHTKVKSKQVILQSRNKHKVIENGCMDTKEGKGGGIQ